MKKSKAAPPPPEPDVFELVVEFVMANPKLVAMIGLLILLKIYALFGGPKPKKWRKPSADEYVDYSNSTAPYYLTDAKAEAPIRLAKKGIGALEPSTLPKIFKKCVEMNGSKSALKQEVDGVWKTWTWSEYYDECQKVAKSLIALGLQAHDCVNIIGFNSPQWFMAQMGSILAGGAAAGVYTTNEASACEYVASHSDARVVFVEDAKQLAKYLTFRDKLKKLAAIVVWGGEVPAGANERGKTPVYSWSDFIAFSKNIRDDQLRARSSAVRPGHCATLIYTSGTTGNPKAVMVSNDNIIWTAITVFETAMKELSLPDNFRVVSYLPLSHVAAQMLDLVAPMVVTACGGDYGPSMLAKVYYTTWFARPDALKGTLKTTLCAARPTIFLGVPRVWEKIKESMQEIGRNNSKGKQAIAGWAKRQSLWAARNRQLGGSGARSISYLLAKKVILSKVKAALGLDQCICCLTGAAPMPREVMEYFASLDLDILDVYGMSESTGGTTVNTPSVHQFGTVGPAIGPMEVRIDHVEGRDKPMEGEICYRGRHIMMGYMKEPAKSAEAIDAEGWLHSGDVGKLDENGMLHITGRIKELIITAGGENIAPVPIEDKFKELCPAVSNIMMVGDKRKYNVCLITLKTELNPETGMSTGKLIGDAARLDKSITTDAQAVAASKTKGSTWQAYLQKGLDELNNKYSVSNAQKIQKFAVLPGDFSEKGGELTATLKLKRSVAEKIHADVIEALYK